MNVYKVFTSNGDKSYCYTKTDALKERTYWKSLGVKKVMIKKGKK